MNEWDYLGLMKATAFVKRRPHERWSIDTSLEATVNNCHEFDEGSVKTDIGSWDFVWDIKTEKSTLRSYKLGKCCSCYEFSTKQKAELPLGIGPVSLSATDIIIETELTICTNGYAKSKVIFTDESLTDDHDGFSMQDDSKFDYVINASGVNKEGWFSNMYGPHQFESVITKSVEKNANPSCDCDK